MIIVRHYQNNSNEKKSRFHYSLHVRNKIISMYECPIIRQTVLAPKLIGSKYHINYNIMTFINTYKCQWITHAFTLTTNFKKLSRVSRSNPISRLAKASLEIGLLRETLESFFQFSVRANTYRMFTLRWVTQRE